MKVKGEGKLGYPVLQGIFEIKKPNMCFKYYKLY